MTHEYYNLRNFPIFVVNHGNWDIYANEAGYCAAIPTREMEARGCKASHFGDMDYVRVTLADELREKAAHDETFWRNQRATANVVETAMRSVTR